MIRNEGVRILLAVVLFSVVSIYTLTDSLTGWTTPPVRQLVRQQATTTSVLDERTGVSRSGQQRQHLTTSNELSTKNENKTITADLQSPSQFSQRLSIADAIREAREEPKQQPGAQPTEYTETSDLTSKKPTRSPRHFPRWGHNDTISVDAILDFVLHNSIHATSPRQNRSQQQYRPTNDHPLRTTVNYWFPETAYVVTREGRLWTSRFHRNILHDHGHNTVRDKLQPTEQAMQRALRRLFDDDASRWPLLHEMLHDDDDNNEGFVFLAWYGDYTGCNYHNWETTDQQSVVSIPLFTPAARADCTHAFPIPNYQTILDIEELERERENETMISSHAAVSEKIRQLVWRGSLTGAVHMDPTTNRSAYRTPRWRLVQHYGNNNNHSSSHLDIAATRLPNRQAHMADRLEPELGPLAPYMNATTTNEYMAVLDLDGNSWSSRFNRLLCGDAVVVKVEPTFVDSLFPTVQAGTHYIPVDANFSRLDDVAAWITDPATEPYVSRVVANAQAWCREQLRMERVEMDLLDSWERYLELSSGVDAWLGVAERVLKEPLLQMETLDKVLQSESTGEDKSEERART